MDAVSSIRPLMSSEAPSEAKVTKEQVDEVRANDEEEQEHVERAAIIKRGPKEPTEYEINDHYAKHVVCRSWCPHFVAGAGKATPHLQSPEADHRVPCHHVDYWFMRDEKGAESIPVVVIKDDDCNAFGAHAVTVRGGVDWVAERLAEDVKSFGHCGKVMVKVDQETAVKDPVREVMQIHESQGLETILEKSKACDSQSDGTAEPAVRSVGCIPRTHKLALKKIGMKDLIIL